MRLRYEKKHLFTPFLHLHKKLGGILLIVYIMLSMNGCSLFNRLSSETIPLKEYALSYTELQLSDKGDGAGYVKQISMTSEDRGWVLTADHELYHTDGGISSFQKVNEFKNTSGICDSYVHGCFPNDTCAYLAYLTEDSIVIESTTSSGAIWTQTHIPYTEWITTDISQVFLSFLDPANGYLLCSSSPGAGQMQKFLFQTRDGGKTFQLVSDLTSSISGFPTGISFSSLEQGFITVTDHGQKEYLFRSIDGGMTWESVALEPYAETAQFFYINAYPPVFWGDDWMEGVLLLQYVSEKPCYAVYQTTDGGMNWNPDGIFYGGSIQSYSFSDNATGFFADYTGTLFSLSSEGPIH